MQGYSATDIRYRWCAWAVAAVIETVQQPEQARAVCRGHANGGGPIVIRNFKSKAAIVHSLAGTKVEYIKS